MEIKQSKESKNPLEKESLLLAKVIEVGENVYFIGAGEKNFMLPKREARKTLQPGDSIWVKLFKNRQGKVMASMHVEGAVQKEYKPAQGVERGEYVSGIVYNVTDQGVFLLSNERLIGFIHNSEIVEPLDIGSEVTARVSFVRPDGRLNLSCRPLKEVGQTEDAQRILETLQARGGSMPYSDETSPEVIKAKFNLSKSSFKRAIGKLMKEDLVEQKDGWTSLKEKEEHKDN